MASTGNTSSNGQTAHMTGKTADSYPDAVFGNVTVNETQHPSSTR